MPKKKQKFVICTVYCQNCDQEIDQLVATEEDKDNGYVQSLVINDAMWVHRKQTKCSGRDGWKLGPWEKAK